MGRTLIHITTLLKIWMQLYSSLHGKSLIFNLLFNQFWSPPTPKKHVWLFSLMLQDVNKLPVSFVFFLALNLSVYKTYKKDEWYES